VIVHQMKQYDEESDEYGYGNNDHKESYDFVEAIDPDLINFDHSLGQLSIQMVDCIRMYCRDSNEDRDIIYRERYTFNCRNELVL
jgi:hypothetical protein